MPWYLNVSGKPVTIASWLKELLPSSILIGQYNVTGQVCERIGNLNWTCFGNNTFGVSELSCIYKIFYRHSREFVKFLLSQISSYTVLWTAYIRLLIYLTYHRLLVFCCFLEKSYKQQESVKQHSLFQQLWKRQMNQNNVITTKLHIDLNKTSD